MADAPPPSYEVATGQASASSSAIPVEGRRSMEDERRPLPPGWARQYDPKSKHQYFVDTTKEPPRRIWHHPYDDEEYLSTLDPEESRKISRKVLTDSGMGEDEIKKRVDGKEPEPKGFHKFARHIKDRVTNSTHEEREEQRRKDAERSKQMMLQRKEEDKKAWEAHNKYREAMARAMETGQPEYVGKDTTGYDVYVEPPHGPGAPADGRGYNPYASGPYANPNARFVRPDDPYQRPYGYGPGSGLGVPILGGLLLGSLLF
jgi:hypothetical protein